MKDCGIYMGKRVIGSGQSSRVAAPAGRSYLRLSSGFSYGRVAGFELHISIANQPHPSTVPPSPSYATNIMMKTVVGALALTALPSALAFRNTSPFFLFSTAE